MAVLAGTSAASPKELEVMVMHKPRQSSISLSQEYCFQLDHRIVYITL